jgi:hypothetical protein
MFHICIDHMRKLHFEINIIDKKIIMFNFFV